MSIPPLDRRTLLRSGATIGCLAFVGWAPAGASPPAGRVSLTDAVVGWLVVSPNGGAQGKFFQVDAQFRPVRQLAVEAIQSMTSIADAALQASTAVVRIVATSWEVSAADCTCGWGRIEHRQSGRSIRFTIWTDFA